MTLTKEYIIEKFNEYNELYFDDNLVQPVFLITHTKRTLGQCITKRNFIRTLHTIQISNYYNRDDNGYNNTILHEMIHLLIQQSGWNDTSSHGKIFKRIARRISLESGMNITTRTTLPTDITVNSSFISKSKKSPNIICIIKFTNGDIYVTKITKNSVSWFDAYFRHHPLRFSSWEWFYSTSPIYDRLRSCRTNLRGLCITNDEYNKIYYPTKEKELNVLTLVNA